MIITALISLIYLFLATMLALLPNSSGFPEEVTSAFTFILTEANKWDFIIPISTLLAVLTLVFTFEAGILLFKGVNWIINKVRGSGG